MITWWATQQRPERVRWTQSCIPYVSIYNIYIYIAIYIYIPIYMYIHLQNGSRLKLLVVLNWSPQLIGVLPGISDLNWPKQLCCCRLCRSCGNKRKLVSTKAKKKSKPHGGYGLSDGHENGENEAWSFETIEIIGIPVASRSRFTPRWCPFSTENSGDSACHRCFGRWPWLCSSYPLAMTNIAMENGHL